MLFFSIKISDATILLKFLDELLMEIQKVNENLNILYWLWLWSDFSCFYSLIFYIYSLCRDYKSKKANLILVETKKPVFPKLIKDSLYYFYNALLVVRFSHNLAVEVVYLTLSSLTPLFLTIMYYLIKFSNNLVIRLMYSK